MIAFKHFLIISFLGFLLASCSSVKVVDSWANQEYAGKTKSIYIMGVFIDDWHQMLFENTFKIRLEREGIESTPSHYDFSKTLEDDQENIIQKMRANGCDSVLLTRVVDQRTKASFTTGSVLYSYAPGPTYKTPQIDDRYLSNSTTYYRNWRDYERKGYQTTPKFSTSTNFVVLTLEFVLYDPQTEEVIWSARMEADLESDRVEMMQDIANKAVKNLKVRGLI